MPFLSSLTCYCYFSFSNSNNYSSLPNQYITLLPYDSTKYIMIVICIRRSKYMEISSKRKEFSA